MHSNHWLVSYVENKFNNLCFKPGHISFSDKNKPFDEVPGLTLPSYSKVLFFYETLNILKLI